MAYLTRQLEKRFWPAALLEIPQPPKKLYIRGSLPQDTHYLTVVGSRKASPYGKRACQTLISGLAGYPVTIVSGLAIGLDAVALTAALDVGLPAIGVPGSGLDPEVMYPASNFRLSENILAAGGALISELEPKERAQIYTFPKRNRIMAGLSMATLIIEAQEKSGTLITARIAIDCNRDVLAVPGPIDAPGSVGTNKLIQDGATPVVESEDILNALGITKKDGSSRTLLSLNGDEERLVSLLSSLGGAASNDELIRPLGWNPQRFTVILSELEIKGVVAQTGSEVALTKT